MKIGLKLALAALVLVAVLGVLAGCSKINAVRYDQGFLGGGARVGTRSPQTVLGVVAPDFTGVDVVTGQPVSLQQFNGQMVLLNFVNYGCSPSINAAVSAQLVAIRELGRQRDDFVPVSVFCGCCPAETLRQFANSNDLNWPWLLDTDNSMITKYSAYLAEFGYPTLIFVDKGQVITDVSGALDLADLSVMMDRTIVGATSASSQIQ